MASRGDEGSDSVGEVMSFTDSSMGANGGGGDDYSLSWGFKINPTITRQPHRPIGNDYSTPNNYSTSIPSTSSSAPIPIPHSLSSTSSTPIAQYMTPAWNQEAIQFQHRLSPFAIHQQDHSTLPNHIKSKHHLSIPLISPLVPLIPGSTNTSFRGKDDTRKILDIWLGINLNKDKSSDFIRNREEIEANEKVFYNLSKLKEIESRNREDELRKALEIGNGLRRREEVEREIDEKRLQKLLLKESRNRDAEGIKGKGKGKGKKKKMTMAEGERMVKMELDSLDEAADPTLNPPSPKSYPSTSPSHSSSSKTTAPSHFKDPINPWSLGVESKRRKARNQLRNQESIKNPILDSLKLLENISGLDEWLFTLLNQRNDSSGLRSSGDVFWGDEEERDNFGSGRENQNEEERELAERERERNNRINIANNQISSQSLNQEINVSNDRNQSQTNTHNQRSNPNSISNPTYRNQTTSSSTLTSRFDSTNRNRRNRIKTVPELMREGWNQNQSQGSSNSSIIR